MLKPTLAGVCIALVAACHPSPLPRDAPGKDLTSPLSFDDAPVVEPDAVARLAQGQLALGDALVAQAPSGNVAYSPLSISMAFSMLSAGARGNTLDELAAALQLPPQEELHLAMNAVAAQLRRRPVPATEFTEGLALSPVNQLFQQDGFLVEQAFLDVLAKRYDGSVRQLDFRSDAEGSRGLINRWVEAQTRERIQDLLPQGSITSDSLVVLVNALYLKGAWATPFEELATRDDTFHARTGDVSTPFMQGDGARATRIGDVDVIELPLVNGEVVVDFFVPRNGAAFSFVDVAASLDDLPPTSATVHLPKFKITLPTDLGAVLDALGVHDLFGDKCDLSGIAEGLSVSGAFHKAFVEVQEGGIEAAAATAIAVGTTSMPIPGGDLFVDEPFFFAVRDRATHAPLFIGRVENPAL
jgi:serpin B